jgi:3-hydroxypropanoate dehydrogenase
MIEAHALDRLFREARTANGFLDQPVTEAQLRALYDLMKMGPTAANGQPARLVFLRSAAARERLKPALSEGNLAKTMSAPVTAIVAYDTCFHDNLPRVFPHAPDARSWFDGEHNRAGREAGAFRNGSMQGGYFILAARAVGLDCGPMSGFDNARVDAEFFPDGRLRSNFICNLGVADPSRTFGRLPRLDFEDACRIL